MIQTLWAQLFLIWVIFWISIWKLSWVFRGKIDVSMENIFWLPKSAQSARSAQTEENSHSFFNVSYTWYKSLAGTVYVPTISFMRIWLIEKIMSKGPWPNNLVFKWWIIFIDKRFPWEFGAHCTKHQAAKVRWNCDKLHERWLCPPSVKVSFSNFCYLTAQSHDKCQLNGGQA